jgi:hypothetical protein
MAVVLLMMSGVRAQESIRPSSTGSEAAAMRKDVSLPMRHNMKLGPILFDASTSLEVEFNDNINISEHNRESDVVFRPNLNIDAMWRVSTLNTLRLNFGVGVATYLEHHGLNSRSILLDPGSAISFDLYIGDVLKLNFHDRFAIVQNPIDEVTLSNAARFDRLQNTAGVTALWDLNDLLLVLGYDHFDYHTFSDNFNFLDRREEQLFGSAALKWTDAITVGLDASAAFVTYKTDYNNNGFTWTSGPFLEMVLSPYTRLRVAAGYQGMNFDGGGTSGDKTDFNGWYATGAIAHRLNQYWSHSLSVGHEARLGLSVNFAEYLFARYTANWRLNSRSGVDFEAFLEDANESGGQELSSEHAFRWGVGAAYSRRLGNSVTMSLRYRFVDKNSDLPERSYYQNIGLLDVTWDF